MDQRFNRPKEFVWQAFPFSPKNPTLGRKGADGASNLFTQRHEDRIRNSHNGSRAPGPAPQCGSRAGRARRTDPAPFRNGADRPMLHPEDFYLPAHQTLYAAALGLHTDNRPVDLVTLAEHLRDQARWNRRAARLISRIWRSRMSARQTPSIMPSSYATNPSSVGSSRRGAKSFRRASTLQRIWPGSSTRPSNPLWRYPAAPVPADSGRCRRSWETWWTPCSNPAEGGSPGSLLAIELDAITRGLQPSDLIIIAARPAMGKTALALNLAMRAAISRRRARGHFLAGNVRTPACPAYDQPVGKDSAGAAFHRPPQQSRGSTLLRNRRSAPDRAAVHQQNAAISTLELRSQARRLKAEHGLGLIVVDYLQLMRSSRRTDSVNSKFRISPARSRL